MTYHQETYRDKLQNFLLKLQERETEFNMEDIKRYPNSIPASFEVNEGSKYDKVIRICYGSRSAYCFINKQTGAILKASSWNQPDVKKYERGNIFNEDCLKGTTRQGIIYFK